MSVDTRPGDAGEPEEPGTGEAESEKVEKWWRLSNETLNGLAKLGCAIATLIAALHGNGGLT